MALLTTTDLGDAALLAGNFSVAYLELGSDQIASADYKAATDIGTAIKSLIAQFMITSNEFQFVAVDTDDTAAYDDFRTLGLWDGDPADAGSELLAIGSTGSAQVYGEKPLGIDLIVSGGLRLLASQVIVGVVYAGADHRQRADWQPRAGQWRRV